MFRVLVTTLFATILLSACASTSRLGNGSFQIYEEDINTCIPKVGEAILAVRLNIEDEQWVVPQAVYEIAGYELNNVYSATEGTLRTANILVTVETIEGAKTKVTMETTRGRVPAMASSAGRTIDHRRNFFEILDKELTVATNQEG